MVEIDDNIEGEETEISNTKLAMYLAMATTHYMREAFKALQEKYNLPEEAWEVYTEAVKKAKLSHE